MRGQKRHDVSWETTKAWVTPRAPYLEANAICGQVLLIRSSVDVAGYTSDLAPGGSPRIVGGERASLLAVIVGSHPTGVSIVSSQSGARLAVDQSASRGRVFWQPGCPGWLGQEAPATLKR